ncbi:MAG: hypothetical protein HYW34_03170 [Candidatus Brennerbacteria bacterium]|nr:hypothetical protein [Candidatus Brennerbacteria bacterium]
MSLLNLLNKKFLIIFCGFLFLLFAGAGIFWFSGGYAKWQASKSAEQKVKQAEEVQARVEEAYRNDTYGGKTPQETLDMFVAALRAGDVDLASKYFALDDNLERGKWLSYLQEIKNKNLLIQMAEDFSRAEFYKKIYEANQQFIIYNSDRTDSLIINFSLNPISKIWKIESL